MAILEKTTPVMTTPAIQPNMVIQRSAPQFGAGLGDAVANEHHPMRFGAGLGDAVANMIGKVDSSKILELTTTDVLGMGIPRTAIEQIQRGPDAAREEAIRNFTATFMNVFLAGLYSYGFIKLFGNTKLYNPKGVPATAFINAESLSAYGRMTEDILTNPKIKTAQQAKEAFYRRALSSLQPGDHMIGGADFAKASQAAGLNGGKAIAYTDRLDDKTVRSLANLYALPEEARQKLAAQALANPDVPVKPSLMERLKLKKAKAKDLTRAFYEGVVEPKARLAGLTEKVNLVDEKTATRVIDRNRKQLVKEIGYFGEHFLARAFDGVDEKATGWKEKVVHNLTHNTGSKLLTKVDDGLIPYALKSKLMYTKWPVFLTIVTSISVAFLNNWLTKRKNGGVNFFPGEGGPQGNTSAAGTSPQMAASAAFPAGSLTRRPNVFAQFDRNASNAVPQPQQLPPELMAMLQQGGFSA